MTRTVFHQVLATMPIYLTEFVMGLGYGWLAPILSQLDTTDPDIYFTAEECSWLAALHYVSRGLSLILIALLLDRCGRVFTYALATFFSCIIWFGVLGSRHVYVHFGIRLLFGLATGIHETTFGIIIGENCSPQLRGTFNTVILVFFYAGEVVAYMLPSYLSYNWVASVNLVFGLITMLSTFLLKETPQFLIMKGKMKRAERNFGWLRGTKDPALMVEFENIQKNVAEEQQKTTFWKLCSSREVYKSCRVTFLTTFLAMMTGFSAVNSFFTMLCSTSGGITPLQLTGIFGIFQMICACGATAIIDRFSRRCLWLTATALITIIHALTASLYCLQRSYKVPYFDFLLFITLTAYASIFGMFTFPLISAIRGELLPQNVKAIGSGSAMLAGSAGGFIASRIFLPITAAFGIEMNFVLFSAMGLILFVYSYLDLPETGGKTLVQIQCELKGIKS